jgi:hypothetical protein
MTPLEAVQYSWIQWAERTLGERLEKYNTYEAYYEGDHPLVFATEKWEEAFGTVFEEFADNWCGVVVDAAAQRMEILGWESEDKAAAKAAEDMWDTKFIGLEAEEVHTQAFVKGDSYIMVWESDDDANDPELYYNDATEVQVHYDSRKKRRITRATKRWIDEDGTNHLAVYFPDHTELYFIPSSTTAAQVAAGIVVPLPTSIPLGWQRDAIVENPYGVIPVFHFKNRGSGGTHGISEIKNVIPLQNGINKMLMDLMLGSEFDSFPQKWMAGGGHPKDGWKTGQNRLWATTDPNARFGEFGQIDLEPIMKSVEMFVGHVAKITQTPMHYLRSSGDMPSGEALKTAESGLVHKVTNRQQHWKMSWSQGMGMMLQINGLDPSAPVFPVWKSAETRHDLEQAQVGQLKAILGIPLEQIWSEHFNYSDEEIRRFKKLNLATFTAVLQKVVAQVGQLPPGIQDGVASAGGTPPGAPGLSQPGAGGTPDLTQLLALLPKSVTAQTPAGEATTHPQPHSRPPGSPTRRNTGFKD